MYCYAIELPVFSLGANKQEIARAQSSTADDQRDKVATSLKS